MMMRRPISFLFLVVATIASGLTVHLFGGALRTTPRDVAGDALWAMMIVWCAGFIAPKARLAVRCISAYAVCVLVELSQLYRSPSLDSVRATTMGHLVLGSGFDPRDLAAYAAGIMLAAVIESLLRHRLSLS